MLLLWCWLVLTRLVRDGAGNRGNPIVSFIPLEYRCYLFWVVSRWHPFVTRPGFVPLPLGIAWGWCAVCRDCVRLSSSPLLT